MEERADQDAVTPLVIPEVVRLPAEIDISNAEPVGRLLCAAARPGVAVVVADMSATRYCDSSGARSLLLAQDSAIRNNAELRLVIPSAAVLVRHFAGGPALVRADCRLGWICSIRSGPWEREGAGHGGGRDGQP